jgi:hypothetical protein
VLVLAVNAGFFGDPSEFTRSDHAPGVVVFRSAFVGQRALFGVAGIVVAVLLAAWVVREWRRIARHSEAIAEQLSAQERHAIEEDGTAALFVPSTTEAGGRWRRVRRHRGVVAAVVFALGLLLVSGSCVHRTPLRHEVVIDAEAARVTVDNAYLIRRPSPRSYPFAQIEQVEFDGSIDGPLSLARGTVRLLLATGERPSISAGRDRIDLAAAIGELASVPVVCVPSSSSCPDTTTP